MAQSQSRAKSAPATNDFTSGLIGRMSVRPAVDYNLGYRGFDFSAKGAAETLTVIVCSCNGITADDVRACATRAGCRQTVSQVIRALDKTPGCGTCSRNILRILKEVQAETDGSGDCRTCPVRAQLEAAKARAGNRPEPVYDFLPQTA